MPTVNVSTVLADNVVNASNRTHKHARNNFARLSVNPKAWHVLRSMVKPLVSSRAWGFISLTTRVGTRLVPLARQTIRIRRTPASPLSFFSCCVECNQGPSCPWRQRRPNVCPCPQLHPNLCRRHWMHGRPNLRSGPSLHGGRTSALALMEGQSTSLASGTTDWRCLGVVGLGSGVAGIRGGTRSESRAWR